MAKELKTPNTKSKGETMNDIVSKVLKKGVLDTPDFKWDFDTPQNDTKERGDPNPSRKNAPENDPKLSPISENTQNDTPMQSAATSELPLPQESPDRGAVEASPIPTFQEESFKTLADLLTVQMNEGFRNIEARINALETYAYQASTRQITDLRNSVKDLQQNLQMIAENTPSIEQQADEQARLGPSPSRLKIQVKSSAQDFAKSPVAQSGVRFSQPKQNDVEMLSDDEQKGGGRELDRERDIHTNPRRRPDEKQSRSVLSSVVRGTHKPNVDRCSESDSSESLNDRTNRDDNDRNPMDPLIAQAFYDMNLVDHRSIYRSSQEKWKAIERATKPPAHYPKFTGV